MEKHSNGLINDYTQNLADNAKRREERREAQKEARKKATRKKIISRVGWMAAGAFLAITCQQAGQCIDGYQKLNDQFYDVTSSYGVTDTTGGFVIIHNGKYTNNEDEWNQMIDEMIKCGQETGLTDQQIATALANRISPIAGKRVSSDVDVSLLGRLATYHDASKTLQPIQNRTL